MSFGEGPLSTPLVIEAIEDLFEPVAIHNNKPGRDGSVLRSFDEPAWNNPVFRLLSADRSDVIPRKDRVWSTAGVVGRMVSALEASERPVPDWLGILADELDERPVETAVFAMHCFWVGEARLGGLDGVVGTRVGWLDGREVVEVLFRPEALSLADLVRAADALECASTVYVSAETSLARARELVGDRARVRKGEVTDAKPTDRLRQLSRSPIRFLPLTPLQAVRANAVVGSSGDVASILSPRQAALLQRIVAVLEDDPEVLGGLVRPGTIEDLARYRSSLEDRLAASEAR